MPKKSRKNLKAWWPKSRIGIIPAVLIGALLAIATMYFLVSLEYIYPAAPESYMNNQSYSAEPTPRDYEADQKAAELANKVADKKMQEIFDTLLAENGKRVELNDEVMNKIKSMMPAFEGHRPLCYAKFNHDPAKTWVEARDPQGEISFNIPFNELWGNKYIKITPYSGGEMGYGADMSFGPLSIEGEGGCGWVRPELLRYLDKKSAQQVLNGIKKSNTEAGYEETKVITVKTLGNKQSISYISGGFCASPSVEVIGKVHNYEISKFCGSEEDLPELEKIAASIKFL